AELLVGDEDIRKTDFKAGSISAGFMVDRPSTYRFILESSGRALREPIAHKIDIENDHAPKVEMFAPSEDLEVTGPKIVEIGYAAEDDYGLSEVILIWQVGAGPPQRKVLRAQIGTRSAQGRFDWDLAEVGLRPGMRVAYHIEALDNDEV